MNVVTLNKTLSDRIRERCVLITLWHQLSFHLLVYCLFERSGFDVTWSNHSAAYHSLLAGWKLLERLLNKEKKLIRYLLQMSVAGMLSRKKNTNQYENQSPTIFNNENIVVNINAVIVEQTCWRHHIQSYTTICEWWWGIELMRNRYNSRWSHCRSRRCGWCWIHHSFIGSTCFGRLKEFVTAKVIIQN